MKLKAFLFQNIPSHYAHIVEQTKDSYIQVIYTLDLDHYYKDNICLIGDAGMVIQPFTGSGVFKGYHNVKNLIACLNEHEILEEALLKWSNKEVETNKRMLALGEQMEKAFIWEQPDFAHAPGHHLPGHPDHPPILSTSFHLTQVAWSST